MEIEQEMRFCEHCQKETMQNVMESAFEIDYQCQECGEQEEFYKTFF